jgi:hypothetical protein
MVIIDDLFEIIYQEATSKNYDLVEYKWIDSKTLDLTQNVNMDPFCVHSIGKEIFQPQLRRRFNRNEYGSRQLPDRYIWGRLIKKDIYVKAVEGIGLIDLQKRFTMHDDTVTTFMLFKYAYSFKKIDKIGLCHFLLPESSGSESKRYNPERIYDTCLTFLNYVDILYTQSEKDEKAREEAFWALDIWIIQTPCKTYEKTLDRVILLAKQFYSDPLISKSNKESTITIVSNSKYYYNPENNKTFILDSFEKKYLEPIGINNKSIYCYMISCFQVLLSIPEMNYYFLYKKYKKSEQKTLICDDYSEFISLYKYFQKNNKNQIDIPPSIYNICHSFLQKDVMNDCEEFFILFLKSMQEELNMKINGNKINNNNENKNDIEKMWNDYRKENDSFIDGLFTGLIRSTVICNKCQNEFYNYEPFMDLAVPIPKKNKSILNCLNIYFDCEYIECNYHCEKCKFDTNVSMIKYNLR